MENFIFCAVRDDAVLQSRNIKTESIVPLQILPLGLNVEHTAVKTMSKSTYRAHMQTQSQIDEWKN